MVFLLIYLIKYVNILQFTDSHAFRCCMRRAMESSVRDGHGLNRMFELYQKIKKDKGQGGEQPTFLSIFDSGNYTFVTGAGPLFEKFCRTKKIGKYTGRNVKVRFPTDAGYNTSCLRAVPFDFAFNFTTHDVDKGKLIPYFHEFQLKKCFLFLMKLKTNSGHE